MQINRENLAGLFQSYNTAFAGGKSAAGQPVRAEHITLAELALIVPSMGAAEIHTWLEQLPFMRKWVGSRHKKKLMLESLKVINDDYENSVVVSRNNIEDDTYGAFSTSMRLLGFNADSLWLKLAVEALIAQGNWADGASVFATDRKYGANTINNKTTSPLSDATYTAALQAMQSYVGEEGEPLEVVPTTLLVGPKLRDTAWDLVKNTTVSAGTGKGGSIQNKLLGSAELKVSPRLVGAYDDYWFLLGEQAGIKAVAVQQRKQPMLTSVTDEASDAVFNRNQFEYGTHARGAAFVTFPHLAYAGIL